MARPRAVGYDFACMPVRDVLLLVVPVALASLVFAPITANYFHADDFLVLHGVVSRGFWPVILAPAAGHLLVVRNFGFYAMYRLFGPDPAPFFCVVLITHALNVWLLFRVIRAFTCNAYLASFGAVLWGASPVNEAVLGWYASYGHAVATSLVLVVLAQLGDRLGRTDPPPARVVWTWVILLVIASLSFGMGLAAAMTFPAVLLLCLPPARQRPARVLPLLTLPLTLTILYVGLHALWRYGFGEDVSGAAGSVARLVHWRPVLDMTGHLLAAGVAALGATVTQARPVYPSAHGAWFAATTACVLVVAWWRSDAEHRRYLVAFLLLATGVSAMVAAGRAFGGITVLQKSVAEMAGTLRYHYLATAVLSALVCTALPAVIRVPLEEWTKATVLASAIAAGAVLYVADGRPIDHHDVARRETAGVLAAVRARVAGQPAGAPVYMDNHPFASVALYMGRFQLPFPGWAAIFLIFHPSGTLEGRPMYFVTRDPRLIAAARGRVRSLLVSPDAVPAGAHSS